MAALLNLFFEVCLLRKGPQDVPASQTLLRLSLLAYGMAGITFTLVEGEVQAALLRTLLDIGLLVGLTWGLLEVTGRRARFEQTLTTLAGTGALLALVALPVALWWQREMASGAPSGLPSLLYLGLLGWSIAVMAHILRHALSTSLAIGVLYTLGYLLAFILLDRLLTG
ncbi:MAG: hypothetical protein R3310_08085 [Candidatus Competibacteraceae bacterium]|nr:hypothetical protein [Candidatus Competibacteraceae bacterium]